MNERIGRLVRDKASDVASTGGSRIVTRGLDDEAMKYAIVDEMESVLGELRQNLRRPGDMGPPERRAHVMTAGGEMLELLMRLGALHRGLTLGEMMIYANHQRKYFGGYGNNLIEVGRDQNG